MKTSVAFWSLYFALLLLGRARLWLHAPRSVDTGPRRHRRKGGG
jgi:hypothetical protein